MGAVLACGGWYTNGEMIADVAKLGYLEGEVLDTTPGKMGFWTHHRPEGLWLSDEDFTKLHWADEAFDSVVFDPPYRLNGTPDLGEFDTRYGTAEKASTSDRLELMLDGLAECIRVTKVDGFTLVKCQAQVVSGEVVWQDIIMSEYAEMMSATLWDRFDLVTPERKQPPGRRQVHARRNHSTLLVFKKWRARVDS